MSLDTFDTLENSLEILLKKWNEEKYDGILGFSQGSILVQIFAFYCEIKKKIHNIEISYVPKFCILSSSFIITDKNVKNEIEIYSKENKIKMPMCLMYGIKDSFIKQEETLKILNYWNKNEIIEHKGGHYVSCTRETCEQLLNFINKYK